MRMVPCFSFSLLAFAPNDCSVRNTRHPRKTLTWQTDKTHVLDKDGDKHKHVQSSASKAAHESRAKDSGDSNATSEKDQRKSNERAKKDAPEAPEPIIGMNDERGGKGF